MKQSTLLRIVHSEDWCLCSVLRTPSGACYKRRNNGQYCMTFWSHSTAQNMKTLCKMSETCSFGLAHFSHKTPVFSFGLKTNPALPILHCVWQIFDVACETVISCVPLISTFLRINPRQAEWNVETRMYYCCDIDLYWMLTKVKFHLISPLCVNVCIAIIICATRILRLLRDDIICDHIFFKPLYVV